MSTIVLRSVKGTPLTNTEVDANFSNLNTDKIQIGGTYSSGTTNGVLFLNASKVLTTGSALTFDGTLLSANSSSSGSTVQLLKLSNTGSGANTKAQIGFFAASTQYSQITGGYGAASTEMNFQLTAASSGFMTWGLSTGAEAMRLTSTGLGIGTSSPTNKLSVDGNANITGNTTLGDASTDTVTVNGYMGIGGAASSDVGLYVISPSLVGASQYGIWSAPVANSNATSLVVGALLTKSTAAASFTTSNAISLRIGNGVKGAGSTITSNTGIEVLDQTNGTNNYGITSLVSSGTNKWNIYASGTAANYFAGNVGIGYATAPDAPLTLDVASGGGVAFTSHDAINLSSGSSLYPAKIKVEQGSSSTIHGLSFWTSNAALPTEKMRITADGNVGIGTSSPASKLVVSNAGALGIEFDPASGGMQVYNRSTSAYGTMNLYANTLYFRTGVSPSINMTLNASGNLGIGTSLPTAVLDVRGAAYVIGTSGTRTTDTANGNGFEVVPGGTNNVLSYNRTSNAYLPIRWRAGVQSWEVDNIERMRIDSSGNVGIGTSSPQAKLEVGGAGQLYINQDQRLEWNIAGSTTIRANIRGTSGNALVFGNRVGGTLTDTMTLDGSGNLGIGTSSPATRLDVNGSTYNPLVIRRDGGTDANTGVVFQLATNYWNAGAGTDGNFGIVYNSANLGTSTQFRITSAGNVGIGTSSPAGIFAVTTGSSGAYFTRTAGDNGVSAPAISLGTASTDTRINASGDSLRFYVGPVGTAAPSQPERMRIDSSGNLGLGVTPSAWRTAVNTKAFQIGSGAALYAQDTGGSYYTTLTSNAFQNTSNQNAYINTGFASSYTQVSGQHIWQTAPSGTAGNAITFTQAMTLTSSGNLGIGTTAPNGILHASTTGRADLRLQSTGASNARFIYQTSIGTASLNYGTGSTSNFSIDIDSSERLRIDSSGKLLVGTTSAVGAANVISPTGFTSRAVALTLNGTSTVTVPNGCICTMASSGFPGDSAIFSIKASGGFQGCYVMAEGTAGNIGFGTTSNPSTGTRLNVWISSDNTMSIQDVGVGARTIYLTFTSVN